MVPAKGNDHILHLIGNAIDQLISAEEGKRRIDAIAERIPVKPGRSLR